MLYRCRGCGFSMEMRWKGLCPGCSGRWAIVTKDASADKEEDTAASLAKPPDYIPTNYGTFDKMIGDGHVGGLVKGCSILLGGPRGCGKSSFMMAIADAAATEKRPVLYAGGEQSKEAIGQIAYRMKALNPNIKIMGSICDIDTIIERCEELRPWLTIFDSLQVMTCDDMKSGEGSVAQGIAVTNVINAHCIRSGMCSIILNHVTRQGEFMGGMSVEHLVDTILMLNPHYHFDGGDEDEDEDEGEDESLFDENGNPKTPYRVLEVADKNRNGRTDLKAYFEMDETGLLKPWRKPSKLEIVR